VRVAIVEPHELMVAGWEQLLETAATDRYRIAAAEAREHPDVTLYGVGQRGGATSHDGDLHALLRTTRSMVIATHWDDTPSAVEAALRCGAHGALSRRLPHEALLAGIESILDEGDPARRPPPVTSCHPEIARVGLSQREVDVLRLVAEGLTNQEIAGRLYLSINTVKSYIRYAYRKIGVERRSQAVLWAELNGLTGSAPGRTLDTAAAR
jgi:DNA-binding NarL/FixJ family response regulator